MKFIKSLWKRLYLEEKLILSATICMVLFTIGYFHGSDGAIFCPLCNRELMPGEYYLWDTRTGELMELSPYLKEEAEELWFDNRYHLPQIVSASRRCGYARFPGSVDSTPYYCSNHQALLSEPEDFYILSVKGSSAICYAILERGTSTPDCHAITKRYDSSMDRWELIIHHDSRIM